ncbi:MAG: cation transporter [Clostridiales bacterium]|nr:cation transporter [Clostridiales bacterium]
MTQLLIHWFVKNPFDTQNPRTRNAYARLSGVTGILMNILLFAGKFLAGTLTGSVAITADSVNNLSDAGSSVISIISFKLAEKPADAEHPFGHARIEYVASLAVAFLIMFLGVELVRDSFDKILHPELAAFNWLAAGVLAASILVKLWLFLFNRKLGKAIDSVVLQATAADSLSDTMATGAVLISSVVSPIIGFSLDGYMGVIVALLIFWSAIGILRETLNKLLGEAPAEEMENMIRKHLLRADGVLGIHDLIVHSYGSGRTFASVHVEVDAKADILLSHDAIDNIEREVLLDHGVQLVIHLDPIVVDDHTVNTLRARVKDLIDTIHPDMSMHDFRVVLGQTHSNLIFDVVVPHECTKSDAQITQEIIRGVKAMDPSYFAVITLDRTYVSCPSHKTKMS